MHAFFHNFSSIPPNTFTIRSPSQGSGWKEQAERIPYQSPSESKTSPNNRPYWLAIPLLLAAVRVSCAVQGNSLVSAGTCYNVNQFLQYYLKYGGIFVAPKIISHFFTTSPENTSLLGRVMHTLNSQKQAILSAGFLPLLFTIFSSPPAAEPPPLQEKAIIPIKAPQPPTSSPLQEVQYGASWSSVLIPIISFLFGAASLRLRRLN